MSEDKKEQTSHSSQSLPYPGGLLAFKLGMTRLFSEKGSTTVTILQSPPHFVTDIKTPEKNGYGALQLGIVEKKTKHLNKSEVEFFKKLNLKPLAYLREFRLSDTSAFKVGAQTSVNVFRVGEKVDVTAISKGKGFQGVIKRHHFQGGPATRGSRFHRTTGSIGMRAKPGKVYKGRKMPGHMGNEQVTVENLEIMDVDLDKNLIVVKGAVPGPTAGLVQVRKVV